MNWKRGLRVRSMEWDGVPMAERCTLLLATGFGLGLAPVASGTTGTLPGLLVAWAMALLPAEWGRVLGALGLACAAVPVCHAAERHFGKKDDGRIVADEYMTFPLCTLGLPLLTEPWLLVVAFFTNRLCDIVKPFPARSLQRVKGGPGIVLDDVFSALYSLALNHAIYWLVSRVM